jgi:hypothetical protein
MFLWYPVMDLARAPRRTARMKVSWYENGSIQKNIIGRWARQQLKLRNKY